MEVRSMRSATGSTRQVLISADGHCGADLRDYKQYLESGYHDEFEVWAATFRDAWAEDVDQDKPENHRCGVASAAAPVNWDGESRDRHLDEEGIVAEVLFPNTPPPFFPSGVLTSPSPRSREEYEHRFAGLGAHNRWLADFCREEPDRRAGVAQIFLDDVDKAVAEVRWAKEAGLRGILLPADHVLKLENLYYPRYDPLWAECEELELPIHRHAAAPTENLYEGGPAAQLIHCVEITFYTGRAISHLIFAGVFERFPGLKFVTTEIAQGSDIATRLEQMDGVFMLRELGPDLPLFEYAKDSLAGLKRPPSEYFATNCYVGGPLDLRSAYDAGVPNIMWGADFPHFEGVSPYSVESIRAWMSDLPAAEIDVLVARRAAEVYGFDLDKLQAHADRIGPAVDSLTTPLSADEWPAYPTETVSSVFRAA
jgi:predicted TIM-barrel fold metal-dependent hydrolase